jgi:hypothetical protein
MLIPAYLAGALALGFVIVCCVLAREGSDGAEVVGRAGAGALLGLASVALLLSLLLMLGGSKLDESGEGWWRPGEGQQFLAAACGWLVLAAAGLSIHRRRYLPAVGFLLAGATSFGLWGLLVEAGWSGRGPLASLEVTLFPSEDPHSRVPTRL